MKKQQPLKLETSSERYYREKNERYERRTLFWKTFWDEVGTLGLILGALLASLVIALAVLGGVGYFLQTDGLVKTTVTDLQKTIDSQHERILQLELWQARTGWDTRRVDAYYNMTTNSLIYTVGPSK